MATSGDVLADRYELIGRVGRGGMATVYRARDRRLERQVAIKLLSPSLLADPRSVERFRRESRAAASLSHPSIVGVYDAMSEGDDHFIVMELLEGGTLADRIAGHGPMPPRTALGVAADIAEALHAAHERGLVHHDVSPRNVLFDRDGTPKIGDFGIARAASSAITTIHGSPSYIAPEQAQGGHANPRSDLYAVGCVLFEMLTGRPPFVGDNAAAVIRQHTDAPRPLVRDLRDEVPAEVDALLARVLAPEPDDRIASAAELRDALRRIAATLPTDTGATRHTVPLSTAATAAVAAGSATLVSHGERDATLSTPSDDRTVSTPSDDRTVPASVQDRTIYGRSAAPVYRAADDGADVGSSPTPAGRGDNARVHHGRAAARLRRWLVIVGVTLLIIVLLAVLWELWRGRASAVDPADSPDAVGEAPGDVPGDTTGGGPLNGLADRIDGLLDRGRDAGDVSGQAARELRSEVADAIRQRAEDTAASRVDEVRRRLDDLVEREEIDEGLADRLRDLLDGS